MNEKSGMEYAQFGDTGERVSRLGFGGAPAGLQDYLEKWDPDTEEARNEVLEALRTALDLGVNYFDTAASYGDGLSEELFGEALEGEDVFVATKASVGDAEHVYSTVEGSLERLRRDQIDVLQIHGTSYSSEDVDTILRDGGMLDGMQALQEEGKVRYIGFTSEDNNDAVYELIRTGAFDMAELCYNFISQHPYIPNRPFGSLYEADDHGMGIATMRTPTSGTFQKWIDTVNPDNTFDYTPALIQFVLSNPLVDVAVIGMRTAEIVRKNADIVADRDGRIDIDDLYDWYV